MTAHSIPRLTSPIFALALTGLALGANPETGVLTSRPRTAQQPVKPLPVGEEVSTRAGERRRVGLAEGTVLYVNEKTSIKRTGDRQLTLAAGEVFLTITGGAKGEALVIRTPRREVTARVARCAVRAGEGGTRIVVAGGRVRVKGVEAAVAAGQQLLPDADRPAPAPRASHLVSWARDLMAEAETPLVPRSQYAGGRLIALDPDGQQAQLALRKYHVDVHVEDGFARTTIDQTYFNHSTSRLEGTFYFPLPPDASLSRLAMYVDGRLMEGGMAEREYARRVFEQVIYQQKDPALLEWLDGSTFKMRVFPLEPRQEKRLVLSYTQKLPDLYGQLSYRFPTGHSLDAVRDWSFHARIKDGAKLSWHSPSHTLQAIREGADLVLDGRQKNVKLDRDVVLTLGGSAGEPGQEAVRFSSAEHEGARYLMVRYRPGLPGQPERQRRDWVFLFESSGDRDPLLARTQIEIVRGLLANAEADDTFAVLTAGTRVRPLDGEAQAVTPENAQKAIAFLEQAHLIGALDLGQALNEAHPYLKAAKNPYLVHVGSGIAAMGERRNDVLAQRIPEGAHYVGVGVGKRWNRAFMKAAAERTTGYFTQINPDETVSWRTFDLAATLNTPRLLDVSVIPLTQPSPPGGEGRVRGAGRTTFLPFTASLAQGEEIAAIARIEGGDRELPHSVVIRGRLNGQVFEKELPVRDVAGEAGYLPRSWAKLEIERLLAEDARKHRERIIALSKAMYVMTPFTSLLVLENDEMYVQFKVDRGRKDHWAMYPCPPKIDIVYEPEDGQPGDPKKGIKPDPRQVRKTILVRNAPRVLQVGGDDDKRIIEKRAAIHLEPPGLERLAQSVQSDETLREYIRIKAGRERMFLEGANDAEREGEVANIQTGITFESDRERRSPGSVGGFVTGVAVVPASAEKFIPELTSGPFNSSVYGIWNGASTETSLFLQGRNAYRNLASNTYSDWSLGLRFTTPVGARLAGGVAPYVPKDSDSGSLLYQCPGYSGEERLFFDLVAYAPGLNTSAADVRAVLEAEAAPQRGGKPGVIAEDVRALFDKARPGGWQSLTLPADGDRPAVTITFDSRGRFAWERTLPIGMRERVVCDGTTLWHLYPDLGLAARRSVSRFHRLDFARLVPWALPRPEDLARGADLHFIDPRTVALVPHGAAEARNSEGKPRPYVQVRFLFADGRLAQRQLVEMPAGKVRYRETYSADGVVKHLDGDDKELSVRKGSLRPAAAPDLKPDTRKLVVLALPYRTRQHVLKTLSIEKKPYEQLTFAEGLQLLAADFAAGNNEIANVFQRCFAGREQHQIGLYLLLAACGQNLDGEHLDVLAQHPQDPLAQYLALHTSPVLRKHASQWAAGSKTWGDGPLHRLALAHALLQRWQNGKAIGGTAAQRQAERGRALEFVRANKGSGFAWALLGLIQDRAREDEDNKKDTRDVHRDLAGAWRLFADVPDLEYPARYEEARSLWKSGQGAEARKRFRELYEQTLKADELPRIDGDFRAALLGDGSDADEWGPLMRQTAARLIARKHRPAVLAMAAQCWQLGDPPQASALLATALDKLPDDRERSAMQRAGLSFLWETGQLPEADQMLRKLLADPKTPRKAELWRLASQLADKRDMPARELECLEQALALEYDHQPDVINLRQVRQDYEKLLGHYEAQARALVSLKLAEPPGFRGKAIRAADRWRALDRDGAAACRLAARILQTLGEHELAWDYTTTPLALHPNEAGPWAALARTLSRQGDLALADRAYRAATAAEPADAQLLYDRAVLLRRAGHIAEARELFHGLADGHWQPRFRALQTQARWQLDRWK